MLRPFSAKYFKNKLSKLLHYIPLFDLIIAIWHIDRIQSGNFSKSKFFDRFPNEAKTTKLTSKFFIYKWSLETLLSLHFVVSSFKQTKGKRNKTLVVKQWPAFANLFNLVQAAEIAEYKTQKHSDIFVELHRIGQRQFCWQRGFATNRTLLRYMYIYGTPETKERFLNEYGISLDNFTKLGFMIWAQTLRYSHTKMTVDFTKFGIENDTRDIFISLISDTPKSAQEYYSKHRSSNALICRYPSRLRTHPLIVFTMNDGGYIACPLADLVFLRVTEGLFYDFVRFPELRETIATRFVDYCFELVVNTRNSFQVEGETEYS